MSEFDFTELALTWITAYGSPMVGVVLFLGALGIPVPGTLIVVASGAFIRQQFLDIYTTPVVALLGAVLGDTTLYGLGRFAHVWITERFGKTETWQQASRTFERRGGLAIYLTRWLLTPLAIPTTLIAGSSGYPLARFLVFDVAGELTWIILFGGLGYAFGSQWEFISEIISNFTGLIVGLLVLGFGIYLLRMRHNQADS